MCHSQSVAARPGPDRRSLTGPACLWGVPQVVEQCCDFLLQRMDGSNCLVSEDLTAAWLTCTISRPDQPSMCVCVSGLPWVCVRVQGILHIANTYHCPSMRQRAEAYIHRHFEAVYQVRHTHRRSTGRQAGGAYELMVPLLLLLVCCGCLPVGGVLGPDPGAALDPALQRVGLAHFRGDHLQR